MSVLGQNAKFRGDWRMSALAPKADISRFMSTRPNWHLWDMTTAIGFQLGLLQTGQVRPGLTARALTSPDATRRPSAPVRRSCCWIAAWRENTPMPRYRPRLKRP